jgi:hypothetical protein
MRRLVVELVLNLLNGHSLRHVCRICRKAKLQLIVSIDVSKHDEEEACGWTCTQSPQWELPASSLQALQEAILRLIVSIDFIEHEEACG